mgnify:CR=1 FL=1
MLTFDDKELRSVAVSLRILNPHAKGYPVNSLVSSMKSMAEQCYSRDRNFGYVSTLGYVLTIFHFDDGKTPGGVPTIKASIGEYTVAEYLKRARNLVNA